MEQPAIGRDEAAAFGFLTVVESPVHGTFGGYLLVDVLGRPLEFHCTAPVRVSRAQAILYGPTLQPHLHGRQIGGALLAESKLAPVVVLTDHEAMLRADGGPAPLALARRVEPTAGGSAFTVGAVEVRCGGGDLEPAVREQLARLGEAVDLCEPFERIRAAIDEAQRH